VVNIGSQDGAPVSKILGLELASIPLGIGIGEVGTLKQLRFLE
jgi:hypothetical protein